MNESTIRALYQFDLSYHSNVAERLRQYQNEEKYWANRKQLSRADKFAAGTVAENLAREKKALFAALTERVKKAQTAESAEIKRVQEAYAEHLKRADAQAEALHQQGMEQKKADYQQLLQIAKTANDVNELAEAAQKLEAFGDYQDSRNLAAHCRQRTAEEQAKLDAEAERQRVAKEKADKARAAKNKRIGILAGIASAIVLAVIVVVTQVVIPNGKYNDAVVLMEAGDRVHAAMAFGKADYKDSAEQSRTLWEQVAVRESVPAGYSHTVGLKADGTVVAVGDNRSGQCDVSDWKLFNSIDTLEDELRQAAENQAERKRREAEARAERKAALEAEAAALQTELSDLKGLFSGKRRREIEARLAAIEAERKGL